MKTTLKAGLWIRMAVAGAITLVGVGLLLLVEFAFATFASVLLLFQAPTFGVMVLFLAAVLGIGFVCWWAVASCLDIIAPGKLSDGIDDDGVADFVADIGAVIRGPPAGRTVGRGIAILVGIGLGLIFGHAALTDGLDADLWVFSFVLGGVAVAGYTVWLVYKEVQSSGTVRANIEQEYDVIEDDERKEPVQRRLQRLANQADCPMPEVRIGSSRQPQAATVGYRTTQSVIIVSRGLVDTLDERELDAVLAHELSHLINRDAALLTALTLPREKAYRIAIVTGWLGIAVALPVTVANFLAVPVVARYREFVADGAAAKLTGDPAALASALATIDKEYTTADSDLRTQGPETAFGIVPPPWQERKVLDRSIRFIRRGVFGTHPPTEARIERLQSRIEHSIR